MSPETIKRTVGVVAMAASLVVFSWPAASQPHPPFEGDKCIGLFKSFPYPSCDCNSSIGGYATSDLTCGDLGCVWGAGWTQSCEGMIPSAQNASGHLSCGTSTARNDVKCDDPEGGLLGSFLVTCSACD